MTADTVPAGTLTFADLTLDPDTGRFTRGGRRGRLTPTEAKLLAFFLANPDRILSRRLILREVWGQEPAHATTSLEVYIGYLRRKTEAGGETRLIHTVNGAGYLLRAPDGPDSGGDAP